MELIFENDFATVKYDRENKVMRASYKGLVKADEGVASFQAMLDVLSDHPLKAAIFDCMKMKGTFTQLNSWLKDVWYPVVIPQGYICWSMATTDVFTRFAGGVLINKMTPKEITANIYGSLDKAEKWVYDFLEKAK